MPRGNRHALRAIAAFSLIGLGLLGLRSWLATRSPAEDAVPVGELSALSTAPTGPALPPLAADGGLHAERAASAAPERSTEIVIAGRFLDETGGAAPSVGLVLKRWQRAEAAERYEALEDLRARADDHGALQLAVPHRPRLALMLRVDDPRYAHRQWSWNEPAPGAREELGDLVLVRGAVVRGRVLDRHGAPIASGWSIEAVRTSPASVQVEQLSLEAQTTNGEFELRGFSAGTWQIEAKLPTYSIASVELELGAGEAREVVLQQTNTRDARSEIVLHVQVSQPHFPGPAPQQVKLLLPGGEIRSADREEVNLRSSRSFLFSQLPAGAYRLTIEDPRFAPWSADVEVPRTQPVYAKLRGSSAIDLSVLDGASGRPVERFAFVLSEHAPSTQAEWLGRFGGISASPLPLEERPGGSALVEDLVAGKLRFVLEAEGWGRRIVEIEDLQPGETRVHRVELAPDLALEGRVRWADGRPVEGALVVAFAPAAKGDHPGAWLLPRNSMSSNEEQCRREIARASSAADGRFRLEAIPAGSCIVTATMAPPGSKDVRPMQEGALCTKVEGVAIPNVGAPEFLEITMPNGAAIHGRILLPESGAIERAAIQLSKIADAESFAKHGRPQAVRLQTLWIDRASRYRFEGLSAGEYELAFALPSDDAELDGNRELQQQQLCPSSLMRIQLESGVSVERDLDLRLLAPAELRAHIAIAGPPTKLSLALAAADHEAGGARFDRVNQSLSCDAEGRAHHRSIHPGRKTILVQGANGAWVKPIAEDLFLAPGAKEEIEAEVALSEGEMQVFDAAGAPLREASFRLAPVLEPRFARLFSLYGADVSSDAEARVRVALPAGRYRLRTQPTLGGSQLQQVEFSWTGGETLQIHLEQPR